MANSCSSPLREVGRGLDEAVTEKLAGRVQSGAAALGRPFRSQADHASRSGGTEPTGLDEFTYRNITSCVPNAIQIAFFAFNISAFRMSHRGLLSRSYSLGLRLMARGSTRP